MKNKDIPIMLGVGDIPNKVAICNDIKRQGKAGGMKFAYRVKSESKVVIMPKRKPLPTFQKNTCHMAGYTSKGYSGENSERWKS